jgi:transposase
MQRTGAAWADLPSRYGSRGPVSSRCYGWRQPRIWPQILAHLPQTTDEPDQLDGAVHFIDSTVMRAHQHAAGAKRGH